MEQLGIFDPQPRARRTDPDTSHAVAARIDARGLALLVLNELRAGGPGTSHELAERMGMSLVTISPRMKPLEDVGKAHRSGKRDGRTIWQAT